MTLRSTGKEVWKKQKKKPDNKYKSFGLHISSHKPFEICNSATTLIACAYSISLLGGKNSTPSIANRCQENEPNLPPGVTLRGDV